MKPIFFYADVDCGIPSEIEHGQFTLVSNATFYGAVVLYECEENYELSGFGRRLCLENGTWSAETPKCKGKCPAEHGFWRCRKFFVR